MTAPAKGLVGALVVQRVVFPENQGHDHADADAEGQREQQPRESQVGPNRDAGVR